MVLSRGPTSIKGGGRSSHPRIYYSIDQKTMWMFLVLSVALGAMGSEETPTSSAQLLQALHCPPCERIHCSSRRALKLQCKGGITTGVCGCCPACARVVGETCGGTWDYLGKCDEGLVCAYQDPPTDKPEAGHKGICKAGKLMFLFLLY